MQDETPETAQVDVLAKPLSRREFLKASGGWAAATALLGTGSYGYIRFAEVSHYSVSHLDMPLPGLDERLHGLKIVQLSDLHMDGIDMTRDTLQSAVQLANNENPDLVVITGDFITTHPEVFAQDLIDGLTKLKSRLGVVGVLGNHDHWSDAPAVRQIMREANVEDLGNRVKTLEVDSVPLHICGLDDSWVEASRPDAVMQAVPRQGTAILLSHEPDFADEWSKLGRFSLNLAGHSHGGQVNVPFVGPIQLPPYGQKYHTGLYRVGDMLLYTSRGLGTLRPHVRAFCRPEIAVFTLKAPGL